MILQVMAAFDVKARAFMLPFYVSHIAVGVRSFREAANTPGHQVAMHPEDFNLYHLGTFSDEDARFALLPQPVQLAMAIQLINKGKDDVQHKVA